MEKEQANPLTGRQRQSLKRRLGILAAFEEVFADPEFSFGQWDTETHAGIVGAMPHFLYSEAAHGFEKAMYKAKWVSLECDWMAWANTPRGQRLLNDNLAIASATADELTAVITACIRNERFCEGSLSFQAKEGRLLAITRRAAALLLQLDKP